MTWNANKNAELAEAVAALGRFLERLPPPHAPGGKGLQFAQIATELRDLLEPFDSGVRVGKSEEVPPSDLRPVPTKNPAHHALPPVQERHDGAILRDDVFSMPAPWVNSEPYDPRN